MPRLLLKAALLAVVLVLGGCAMPPAYYPNGQQIPLGPVLGGMAGAAIGPKHNPWVGAGAGALLGGLLFPQQQQQQSYGYGGGYGGGGYGYGYGQGYSQSPYGYGYRGY